MKCKIHFVSYAGVENVSPTHTSLRISEELITFLEFLAVLDQELLLLSISSYSISMPRLANPTTFQLTQVNSVLRNLSSLLCGRTSNFPRSQQVTFLGRLLISEFDL